MIHQRSKAIEKAAIAIGVLFFPATALATGDWELLGLFFLLVYIGVIWLIPVIAGLISITLYCEKKKISLSRLKKFLILLGAVAGAHVLGFVIILIIG